jgi:hypothetical protein
MRCLGSRTFVAALVTCLCSAVMGSTVSAEPITVIASWQLEASMERTGRQVLLRARALDELQAPLPAQPVVIEWSSPGRESISQVYMTDRSGLLVASWTLDDGPWTWTVSMPDDPWAITPTVTGSVDVAAEQVAFIALQPTLVEAGTAPWSLDLAATTSAGVRARNLEAQASLWCDGEMVSSRSLTTDASGRATWSTDYALRAAQQCELRVNCDHRETGIIADSRLPVRSPGTPVIRGSVRASGRFLGLTTEWSLELQVEDENGALPAGQFEVLQDGSRVGLWPASDAGPFDLSADSIIPEQGPLTVLWTWLPADTEPRATISLPLPAAPGMWQWMLGAALAVLLLLVGVRSGAAIAARIRVRTAERARAGSAAGRAAGAVPGIVVVDADSLLPVAAFVSQGGDTVAVPDGRWVARGLGDSDVLVSSPGYESVTVQADLVRTTTRRVALRPWRRVIIDELLSVLVERGIHGASEAWWGRRSPSQLQPDALLAVRGLRADRESDGRVIDWRAAATTERIAPHDALRALFALVDEAAFGPPERLDSSWTDAAAMLAVRVRQTRTTGGDP